MAVVAAVVALSARLPDPATVPDGPLLHFRESYALLDGKRNGNPQVYKPNIYESWSRQWPESACDKTGYKYYIDNYERRQGLEILPPNWKGAERSNWFQGLQQGGLPLSPTGPWLSLPRGPLATGNTKESSLILRIE